MSLRWYKKLKMEVEFIIEGPKSEQTFKTKIVGVTYNNPDGTSRQELLSECCNNDNITLKRDYDNEHDKYAIQVLNKRGQQLGFLKSDSRLAFHMDTNSETNAHIFRIIGGKSILDKVFGRKGKNYGCILQITKGSIKEEHLAEWDKYSKLSNEIRDIVRKAYSNEKSNCTKAIDQYEYAIEKIKDLDSQGHMAKALRYERIPVNRLSLLLFREKQFEKAHLLLNWYDDYNDYIGLTKTDAEGVAKRQIRIAEKLNNQRSPNTRSST